MKQSATLLLFGEIRTHGEVCYPKKLVWSIAITLILTLGFVLGTTVSSLRTSPDVNIYLDGLSYPATYVIDKEGSSYIATRDDGKVVFIGSKADEIIQNEINALPRIGGTILLKAGIYLLEGSYNYDSNIFSISKDNVRITGEGWNSIVKLADDSTKGSDGARIFWISGDNCILDNFAIDGNYKNQGRINQSRDGFNVHCHGDNFAMYNMFSHHGTGDGVEFGGTRNSIANCKFVENWEHNIHANQAKDGVIIGNLLENKINNGMLSLNPTSSGRTTEKIVISHNILHGGQENGIKIGGAGSVDNIVVSNNIIVGTIGFGIFVRGNLNRDIQIMDNIIRACTEGIRVELGDNIKIANNLITHCNHSGISLSLKKEASHITIQDNKIFDNNQNDRDGSGILLDNGDYNISGLYILRNEIVSKGTKQHKYGIAISASGSGDYLNSFIKDNFISSFQIEGIGLNKDIMEVTQNTGFLTENRGVGIISGSTSASFDHGLVKTPTYVEIGWKDIGYGEWKWSATDAQITITVTNSGTYHFNWYAQYEP